MYIDSRSPRSRYKSGDLILIGKPDGVPDDQVIQLYSSHILILYSFTGNGNANHYSNEISYKILNENNIGNHARINEAMSSFLCLSQEFIETYGTKIGNITSDSLPFSLEMKLTDMILLYHTIKEHGYLDKGDEIE